MINETLIRECAYGIWESEGRPADRAEAHWSLAAAQLAAAKPARKRAAAATATMPSVKSPAPARKPRKATATA